MINATTNSDDHQPPDPDEECQRIESLVKRHALAISEHVDSVRIFITANRGDGCYGTYSYGEGNFFAQRDSVREWIMRKDQETRNDAD